MSIGLFTDKKYQPTDAEVRQVVGSKLPLWEALIRFIRENHSAQEDFKFLYGKNYGWAWRFRIKGQLLTSLYPTDGGFTVQINLSPDAVEKAQAMKLTKNAQLAIEHANPYPEGRWLFIPVETKSDLQSVQQLLALRVGDKHLSKEPLA
jgi:hypothetical protein